MKGVIDVEFNDQAVTKALNELLQRVENPTPAMKNIADVLEQATDQAFANETDPATGIAWAPLSDVTLAVRPIREGGDLLQDTRRLQRSMVSDFGKDFAEVGTNVIYGPPHQFGAKQGEFGRTRRGGPIPWGDIPARPFFGVSPQDERDILDIARDHLASAFKKS